MCLQEKILCPKWEQSQAGKMVHGEKDVVGKQRMEKGYFFQMKAK